jgi:hypothetical protein
VISLPARCLTAAAPKRIAAAINLFGPLGPKMTNLKA